MSSVLPPENPIILDITDSYGALIIGVVLSSVIWGISCTQAFIYFFNDNVDGKLFKCWVVALIVFDLANEILCIAGLWKVLVLQYGRIAGLTEVQPELSHHSWVTGVISVSIQYFFLYRIYVFSGRRRAYLCFSIFMAFISIWQLVEVIPYNILAFQDFNLPNLAKPRMVGLATALRACSSLVDISISVALTYLLTHGNRPSFTRTRQMLYRLLMLTILSGLWTTIFSILVLVLVAASPATLWYCVFEFPITSLYLSTLLANLNARSFVRNAGEGDGINYASELVWQSTRDHSNGAPTLFLSTINRSDQSTVVLNHQKDPGISIQVDTSRQTQLDLDTQSTNEGTQDKVAHSV